MRVRLGCAALLLAGVLSACSPASTPGTPAPAGTPIPTGTATGSAGMPTGTHEAPPALPVLAAPTLLKITFQNSVDGWALADGAIVRTVDGGATWLNATPAGLTGIGFSDDLFVLDGDHAWLQVPNADFYTGTLYRTVDGGLTWTSFADPFGGAQIQFLDASTGRLMADRGAASGSQAVEFYQSGDGGATWTSVFHNDPAQSGSSDSLPLSGIKTGMIFLNASTGWVTGTRPVDGEIYLFVTHDGGASWSEQAVPLPAGFESYQYTAQEPVFFGTDGLLPVNFYMDSGVFEQVFFVTHDGGASWSGAPGDADQAIATPGSYAFSDPTHGLAWDGGAVLFNAYALTPGNPGWRGTNTDLDLSERLTQLAYVAGPGDGHTAWALTAPDDSNHSQLYRSTDDGASWTALIP